MAKNNAVFELVTNAVIKALEEGVCPWQKPWSYTANATDVAISYVTRKPYSWLNQMLLPIGEYITISQCNKLGGRVKKGASAYNVYAFFPFWVDAEGNTHDKPTTEEDRKCFSLRYYRVFNITDCEGIKPHIKPTEEVDEGNTIDPIEVAENAIKAYVERSHITFHNVKGDRAYYSPSQDIVVVPTLKQYKCREEYYSTAFHELTHSSGHKDRLARKGVVNNDGFGNHEYSKEELVAEMGSAMLLGNLGINSKKAFNNSVAYLQSWLNSLKNDPQMIVWAAANAETAAKYILNIK